MPPKVLHIVETMGRGATENLLLRMLARAREMAIPVNWTFYCTLPDLGSRHEQAIALGARVIASPVAIGRKLPFATALRRELVRGQYDVLHSHHDLVSGFYLLAAAGLPIRRIVHVHNAGEGVLTDHPIKRAFLREILRTTCLRLADRIVGVSHHTLATFLARRPRKSARDWVIHSGVDASAFKGQYPDRTIFRSALGLNPDAAILLFGGRMVAEKNPRFVVDLLACLRAADQRVVAVFAGAGPEEAEVLRHAERLGVDRYVRLLGWREDFPAVMRCADWFVLPAPEEVMEGFGLAVVEAQLAGLRLLVSRGIADDPVLPRARYRRLALADGPQAWADAAHALLDDPAPDPVEALADLACSPMDLDRALANLLKLYE